MHDLFRFRTLLTATLQAALLLTVLLLSGSARAHPLSVSPMDVRLIAGGWEADLIVDAPTAPRTQDATRRLEHELRAGVFIKIDGVPQHYTIDVVSLGDPTRDPEAVHRLNLRGALSEDARNLSVKVTRSFGGLRLGISDPSRELSAAFLVPGGYETPEFQLRGPVAVVGAVPGRPIEVGPLPPSFFERSAAIDNDPGDENESSAATSVSSTVGRYLVLGFEHILPLGLDHILFVLALFLLSPRLKPLLLQLTGFTVAHSLTLGLVALGIMSPPASLVEPLIAASILFVGVENLRKRSLHAVRLCVVVLFGLLHGMGFAGVLGELGLPAGQEWWALAAFNVGVELGQIAVVGIALLVTWRSRIDGEHPSWIRVPASGAIALMGLFWVIERLL